MPKAKKCSTNSDCEVIWPGSTCQRSRCRCPENYVRRKSPSREWVCLAVNDAATGQVGPPLTCPLPDGAGYQVVLRNDLLAQRNPVLCSPSTNDCMTGYECIQGLAAIGGMDGVCCPDQITTCAHPIFDHESGTLERWGFDGVKCKKFKWDPEKPSSANNFKTREQCESYCVNIFS
ncbi:Kunitz/Bovine pancreatic trypsin inhibitor domain protein [Necator americanus]|uniref:Kunitz/Bovine pancreatic trypsin inhibitor domain protein n=1 Tax=Necator americanus TaxID=51031 RepID=W2SR57_NECAM|nr:Kunitz/Bovine pancreatic trypsin inhibitor domain protein [Necator americanus]ETN71182.1 Kunitz/Bovine pancreatic trypsin inhibitor domain protein [Necator americanus]